MADKFNYSNGRTPKGYKCQCGASNCKMWRQYNTFLSHIQLLCVDCALKDQKETIEIDEDGYHKGEIARTCEIGWLVPAIPTEENDTFWGYTSIPDEGVAWWKRLPLR